MADLAGNRMFAAYRWRFRIFDRVDLDHDGVPDELEKDLGLDPAKSDTNNNGILDGDEDFDRDGFAVVWPKDAGKLKPQFAGKPPLWDTLDVAILHVAILEAFLGIDEVKLREESNVTYWREPEPVVARVRSGEAQLGFFLTPTWASRRWGLGSTGRAAM